MLSHPIDCVSVETMRESDRLTIENKTPSRTLMYRAAMGIFLSTDKWRNTAILCGGGNNGGDGFALACILADSRLPCKIFTLSSSLSPDGAYFSALAAQKGVESEAYSGGCLSAFDTVADCMLGTGFSGEVRGNYALAINEVNSLGAFVVSADINSGLSGDTGKGSPAVSSDITVTIGLVKNGLVRGDAPAYIKRLVLADIGIPACREENFIVPDELWKKEYEGDSRFIPAPSYFDSNITDTSDFSY